MISYKYIYPCEHCPSATVDVNSREPYFCMAKKYYSGTLIGLFNDGCPYDNTVKIVKYIGG